MEKLEKWYEPDTLKRAQRITDFAIKEMKSKGIENVIVYCYVSEEEIDCLSQFFVCERLKRHYSMSAAIELMLREKEL